MAEYTTVFGSLDNYEKGRVVIVDDDPKAYVFSNVFEVANMSKPYEKVAVGKNLEYVLEAVRCEGTSQWRATPHDEFALVMDGTVVVELLDPDAELVDPNSNGSIGLDGEPAGKRMGRVTATQGHQIMLPAGKRVPLQLRRGRRDPAPDHRRPRHGLPLGRDLPDRSVREDHRS